MKLTGPKAVALLEKTNAGITERYETFQRQLLIDGKRNLVAALNPSGVVSEPVAESQADRQDDGINPADYFYVTGKSLPYFDRKSQTFLSKDNLDSIYRRQHQGTKASPTASKVFDLAMDRDKQLAHGLAWEPTTRHPTLPTLVNQGTKKLINVWAGIQMRPKKGDVKPWLDLLEFVIPDEEQRKLVIQWQAHQLQHIGKKINWQIVLLGEKGVGKDAIFTPLARILGRNAGDITAEQIKTGWGDYLAEKKLLMFQEIYQPQNRGFANSIKTWAADTANGTTTVNMKGGKVIEQANVMGMVLMSNHKSGFTLEKGERRYFVLNAFFEPKPKEYYAEWGRYIGSPSNPTDASAYVYDYLLNVDLSDFDPTRAPYMTAAAEDLIDRSDADYVQALKELEAQGAGPFACSTLTLEQASDYLKRKGMYSSRNGVKDALESMGYTQYRGAKKIDGKVVATPRFFSKAALGKAGEVYDYYYAEEEKRLAKLKL